MAFFEWSLNLFLNSNLGCCRELLKTPKNWIPAASLNLMMLFSCPRRLSLDFEDLLGPYIDCLSHSKIYRAKQSLCLLIHNTIKSPYALQLIVIWKNYGTIHSQRKKRLDNYCYVSVRYVSALWIQWECALCIFTRFSNFDYFYYLLHARIHQMKPLVITNNVLEKKSFSMFQCLHLHLCCYINARYENALSTKLPPI